MENRVSIRVFSVLQHIVFQCAFCDTGIDVSRKNTHEISYLGYCGQCEADYHITWNDGMHPNIEQFQKAI